MSMDGMDMDHGGHSSGGDTSSNTMVMQSVFQTDRATPLFSTAWTPQTTGSYAGTCIFIIILAVIMRVLLAGKAALEARWLDRELKRRFVVVEGRTTLRERVSVDTEAKRGVLTENGLEEDVLVVGKRGLTVVPWRLSVDPVRACVDVVIAGVGYLLMLAVMTMNVGYFLSALGGTFLGSLLVGRFTVMDHHH